MHSLKGLSIFLFVLGTILLIIGLYFFYKTIYNYDSIHTLYNVGSSVMIVIGIVLMLASIIDLSVSYDYTTHDIRDAVKNGYNYDVTEVKPTSKIPNNPTTSDTTNPTDMLSS